MGRLYRQLALVCSAMLITTMATTQSGAQESCREIGRRITSARQYNDANLAQTVPSLLYAVQPASYNDSAPEINVSSTSVGDAHVSDEAYSGDNACCDSGCCDSGCCDSGCGSRGCGHRRNRQVEGAADPWFNCSCNGSYKFPVPPLYTYHWPGMYSQELMTNYHSPWRFPPLRPYVDEPRDDVDEDTQAGLEPGHLPVVQASAETRSRGYERLSSKIERFYGITR